MTNKFLRLTALLVCLATLLTLAASASGYSSPSPKPPEVVEGEDDDGNDLTEPPFSDILKVTPYLRKDEMRQSYKQDNFDIAMEALTWEAAEFALEPYMTPDMNPRNLTAVSVFYVHEQDDNRIVRLPARLRITTPLKPTDFVELLAFRTRARGAQEESGDPDHTGYVWLRIPSTMHEDGTLEFIAEDFGSYAIITYHAQETPDPTDPDPTTPTTKPGDTPHSPPTGEPDSSFPGLAFALLAAAAFLGLRKKH